MNHRKINVGDLVVPKGCPLEQSPVRLYIVLSSESGFNKRHMLSIVPVHAQGSNPVTYWDDGVVLATEDQIKLYIAHYNGADEKLFEPACDVTQMLSDKLKSMQNTKLPGNRYLFRMSLAASESDTKFVSDCAEEFMDVLNDHVGSKKFRIIHTTQNGCVVIRVGDSYGNEYLELNYPVSNSRDVMCSSPMLGYTTGCTTSACLVREISSILSQIEIKSFLSGYFKDLVL